MWRQGEYIYLLRKDNAANVELNDEIDNTNDNSLSNKDNLCYLILYKIELNDNFKSQSNNNKNKNNSKITKTNTKTKIKNNQRWQTTTDTLYTGKRVKITEC